MAALRIVGHCLSPYVRKVPALYPADVADRARAGP